MSLGEGFGVGRVGGWGGDQQRNWQVNAQALSKLFSKLPLRLSPTYAGFDVFGIHPGHLRPVVIKPVGRISKSAIRTRYGENAENAEGPSHPRKTRV